jgi:hypothetical protein
VLVCIEIGLERLHNGRENDCATESCDSQRVLDFYIFIEY